MDTAASSNYNLWNTLKIQMKKSENDEYQVKSKMRHKWTYLQNKNSFTDTDNDVKVTIRGKEMGEG